MTLRQCTVEYFDQPEELPTEEFVFAKVTYPGRAPVAIMLVPKEHHWVMNVEGREQLICQRMVIKQKRPVSLGFILNAAQVALWGNLVHNGI